MQRDTDDVAGSVAEFTWLVNCLRGVEQGVRQERDQRMSGEIVLWAVHWYCRYAASYHDLQAMTTERGVAVDHSTIYRRV